MTTYKLRILTPYGGFFDVVVIAESYEASSAGMYSFYADNLLVSAYPINFTIIQSVEYNTYGK